MKRKVIKTDGETCSGGGAGMKEKNPQEKYCPGNGRSLPRQCRGRLRWKELRAEAASTP